MLLRKLFFLSIVGLPTQAATLNGKVVDIGEHGKGLVGVTVIVEQSGRTSQPVLTNAQGLYQISGLAPGAASVKFDKVQYAPKVPTPVEVKEPASVLDREMYRNEGADSPYTLRVLIYQQVMTQFAATGAKEPTNDLWPLVAKLQAEFTGEGPAITEGDLTAAHFTMAMTAEFLTARTKALDATRGTNGVNVMLRYQKALALDPERSAIERARTAGK